MTLMDIIQWILHVNLMTVLFWSVVGFIGLSIVVCFLISFAEFPDKI